MLKKKDWKKFNELLMNAANSELNKMLNEVSNELSLSERAIREGMEVRK